MNIRAASLAALSLAAMSLAAPTANAAPEPCGYFESGYGYHYNHCASGHVKIHIDVVRGFDETRCVGGGISLLGLKAKGREVRNAWYIGEC